MKMFMIRLAAVGLALATLLLVDAMIQGTLPLLVALLLLPAALISTGHLLGVGARPVRRAGHRPRQSPPPRHGAAAPRASRPALTALQGGRGSRAA